VGVVTLIVGDQNLALHAFTQTRSPPRPVLLV
jgi:hypothetical protein